MKSKNVVLYNLNDNEIIFEKDMEERVSVASLTKIMTGLVAIENIDNFDKKIIMKKDFFANLYEINAALVGFEVGDAVTYNDLLYALLLPSGAEAANAIAVNVGGSLSGFLELMNQKAEELGLLNTHFSNVIGLDTDDNYSSAYDIAVLLKAALENKKFSEIFYSKKYVTSDGSITFESTLEKYSKYYEIPVDYILGGKTGYTTEAGRCLASVGYDENNDIYYLLVTLRAPTDTNYYHLLDAKSIYEYYFNNYSYHNIVNSGDILTTIKTKNAREKEVKITADKDILKYMNNTFDSTKIVYKYNGMEEIKYNEKVGTKLGTIDIIYEEKILKTIDVFLTEDLHFSLFVFIKNNIILSVVVLIILILIIKKVFF